MGVAVPQRGDLLRVDDGILPDALRRGAAEP